MVRMYSIIKQGDWFTMGWLACGCFRRWLYWLVCMNIRRGDASAASEWAKQMVLTWSPALFSKQMLQLP